MDSSAPKHLWVPFNSRLTTQWCCWWKNPSSGGRRTEAVVVLVGGQETECFRNDWKGIYKSVFSFCILKFFRVGAKQTILPIIVQLLTVTFLSFSFVLGQWRVLKHTQLHSM